MTEYKVVKIGPEPGQIVHIGPGCLPAIVFAHGTTRTEVYVRALVPKLKATSGLRWGKLMAVIPQDMEGWVSFGNEETDWHWPERPHT